MITWSSRTSAGRWLAASGTPGTTLVTFGPLQFEAYARLRFVPDPVRRGQQESDQDLPDDHPSELDRVRRALRVLAAFTTTPDDCWFAVWDGYPGSLDLPAGLPRLALPHRRYGLLHGALADVDRWEEAVGSRFAVAPAFVWPADHAWCLAADVDPHWAGLGARGGRRDDPAARARPGRRPGRPDRAATHVPLTDVGLPACAAAQKSFGRKCPSRSRLSMPSRLCPVSSGMRRKTKIHAATLKAA